MAPQSQHPLTSHTVVDSIGYLFPNSIYACEVVILISACIIMLPRFTHAAVTWIHVGTVLAAVVVIYIAAFI